MDRPKIVCISGSMRFEEQMRAAAVDLSLEGAIVTGPFVNMKKPDPRWATDELADPVKVALDELHFRKIDLADEVVVVSDESGYFGSSTRNEIAYAEEHGKPIRYLSVSLPYISEEEALAAERDAARREVERLTAEVERLTAIIRKSDAQDKADLEAALRQRNKEYGRASQEIGHQRAVLARQYTRDAGVRAMRRERNEALAEVSRLREQLATQTLRANVHQERGDQLVVGLRRLLDNDRVIENGPAPVEVDESGVSSSEVEAPQPTQHKVSIRFAGLTGYSAWCDACNDGVAGSKAAAEDWRDQHEADTLRPQLQANSKLEQNLDEGRPSGSERLGPRPGFKPGDLVRWNGSTGWFEGAIAKTTEPRDVMWAEKWDVFVLDGGTFYTADKPAPADGIVHVEEQALTLLSRPEDAAQAARSEATPHPDQVLLLAKIAELQARGPVRHASEEDPPPSPSLRKEGEDTQPRTFYFGTFYFADSVEPSDVKHLRDNEGDVWERRDTGKWHCLNDTAWPPYYFQRLLHDFGPLVEVLPSVSTQEETKEGETDAPL